jgi:hypothetical protein
MPSLLQRLYRLKLAFIGTILTFVGIGLLCTTQWGAWSWLDNSLTRELGGTMFGTGLLAVGFEYFAGRQADKLVEERLRAVLTEQAPAIADAVIDAQAMRPELAHSVAPSTLDKAIVNAMAVRLGNAELAHDAYTDLREQIIRAGIRRYNLDVSATLSPWSHGPAVGYGSMFVATVRCEFRTPNLPETLRFSAVTDPTRYRALLREESVIEACLFDMATVGIGHPDAYRLVHCDINGEPQPIRHEHTDASRVFTVTPTKRALVGDEANVSYTIRTLVTQHGHLFFLDFGTVKGLRATFTYTSDCGIRYVEFLDFIASAQQVRATRSPDDVPTRSLRLSFDGWTLPRSGAAFVWVLDRELH